MVAQSRPVTSTNTRSQKTYGRGETRHQWTDKRIYGKSRQIPLTNAYLLRWLNDSMFVTARGANEKSVPPSPKPLSRSTRGVQGGTSACICICSAPSCKAGGTVARLPRTPGTGVPWRERRYVAATDGNGAVRVQFRERRLRPDSGDPRGSRNSRLRLTVACHGIESPGTSLRERV